MNEKNKYCKYSSQYCLDEKRKKCIHFPSGIGGIRFQKFKEEFEKMINEKCINECAYHFYLILTGLKRTEEDLVETEKKLKEIRKRTKKLPDELKDYHPLCYNCGNEYDCEYKDEMRKNIGKQFTEYDYYLGTTHYWQNDKDCICNNYIEDDLQI